MSLDQLQPDMQIQLLRELIRQRLTITNAAGWMVKMVRLAKTGHFTPSADTKDLAPAIIETNKMNFEKGQGIWQELSSRNRDEVAVKLDKYLVTVAPRCADLKQLRKHGIDHPSVRNVLYEFLAERFHPPL